MVRNNVSDAVFGLLQSEGGLFASTFRHEAQGPEPKFTTRMVQVGDISQVGNHDKCCGHGDLRRVPAQPPTVSGAGVGVEDNEAFFLALTEALERYCACVFDRERFTFATAAELGEDALDLHTIPRCSAQELSHPLCPVVDPAKDHRSDGCVRCRCSMAARLCPGRDGLPVGRGSTRAPSDCVSADDGCAAHVTCEQALVSAILEVIERDAISIVWLQQLALPKIVVDRVSPALAACWERYQHSSETWNTLLRRDVRPWRTHRLWPSAQPLERGGVHAGVLQLGSECVGCRREDDPGHGEYSRGVSQPAAGARQLG